MNKLVLISVSLILTSSAFSMSSNKAVILEHKTEVTGADSQGRAVSGHLDNGPIIYPSKPKNSWVFPIYLNLLHILSITKKHDQITSF